MSQIKQKNHLLQIQYKLIEYHPQLKQKRLIVRYYVSLDIPKQRNRIVKWWQNMIQSAIEQAKQVYLSPAQLEIIFTLHGLKPVPLRSVLQIISLNQNQFQWRDRSRIQQQKQSLPTTNAIKSIVAYVLPIKDKNLKLTKYKNLQNDSQSKVIPTQYFREKIRQANQLLQYQFNVDKNIQYQYILKRFNDFLNLKNKASQYLLEELSHRSDIIIDTVANKRVIFYGQEIRNSNNKQWLQIQKQKFQLKCTINTFNQKLDQKTKQEESKMQQAKKALQTNKQKAKKILTEVKHIRNSINILNQRLLALKSSLNDLQLNEVNIAVIDVIKNAQQTLKSTMKDPAMLEQIIQKNEDIKLNQKQMNQRFDELNHVGNDEQDIMDQVDNMMAELQKDIAANKKRNQQSDKKFTNDEILAQNMQIVPPEILFRDTQFN